MTIANFKLMVAGFINRDASIFTVGTVDHILQAMNSARRAAQREHTFELLRKDVFLTTSAAGADWTSGCVNTPGATPGTSTTVLMKKIDSVWKYSTGAVGATTTYLRTQRIDLGNVNDYKRELPVYSGTPDISSGCNINAQRVFAFCNGPLLVINNVSTAAPFLLNGIAWADDLTGSESADIFLTYFTDWFLWGTLLQLNQFLRSADRVQVDSAFVQRLWKSVIQLDGELANAGDNASLD